MSLESMKNRIKFHGGAAQQDRMIRDKLRSMLSATKYSYQAARFNKYPLLDNSVVGLFNPVTQNMDYDTKMISTEFKNGYKPGDIFLWENTNTYWICYTRDRTELAYFRGACRRCDYKVQWVNGEREILETLISVIGPSQPDLESQVNGSSKTSNDLPTANLVVLTTDNEQNRRYFNQYQTFVLKGETYKIKQIDNLSMPGVIQMNCERYYTNLIEDDVEEDLSNAWNVQPVIPEHPTEYGIEGPLSIKPLFEAEFEAIVSGGHWICVENESAPYNRQLPVHFVESNVHQKVIHVKWTAPTSGAFTIGYQMPNGVLYQRHVLVESLM